MTETNLNQFKEVTPGGTFTLQNSSLLKVRLEDDVVQAKLGSMVAYQGGVTFDHKGGASAGSSKRPSRARVWI